MSNFTPQQIEEFLQEFFDVVGARQYVGARYVPIFGRAGETTIEWDDDAPYEPLTVVMHRGISYVSRRYVPKDIQITDTAYWAETYRFNAQVEQYRQEVLGFSDRIDAIAERMDSDFVPFPTGTESKYGADGQVLSTLTDGSTRWVDPVVPSDAQAEAVITEWLDEHPEATTTVLDGSITRAKLAAGLTGELDALDRNGVGVASTQGYVPIAFVDGARIMTVDGATLEVEQGVTTYAYAMVECAEGDHFQLSCRGSVTTDDYATFAFYGPQNASDLTYPLIARSERRMVPNEVVAPAGSRYLVLNNVYSQVASPHAGRGGLGQSMLGDLRVLGANYGLAELFELGSITRTTGVEVEANNRIRTAGFLSWDRFESIDIAYDASGLRFTLSVCVYNAAGTIVGYTPSPNITGPHVTKATIADALSYLSRYSLADVSLMRITVFPYYELDLRPIPFGSIVLNLREIEPDTQTVGSDTMALLRSRFDERFNAIAYSSVSNDRGHINTLAHFQYCGGLDVFTALKGDLRVTSDNKLVMCHDVGFTLVDGYVTTFDSSNYTAIRTLTEAQCLALRWDGPDGDPICSFEDYVHTCKTYGKIAFVTIRDEYMSDLVPEMLRILTKYGMVARTIVNSFTLESLAAVRDADQTIMLSWVQLNTDREITTAKVNVCIGLGNCLLCGFDFPNGGGVTALQNYQAAIDYAHAMDVRVYDAIVGSSTSPSTLMRYGVTGAQLSYVPGA